MAKEKKSFFEKIIKSPAAEKSEAEAKSKVNISLGGTDGESEPPENIEEGQLSVDVYEAGPAIVVESIIGGITDENIGISLDNNVLTISGAREKTEEGEKRSYFVAECFWGPFSRSIILPVEVDIEQTKASMKNGVLKVTLLKMSARKSKKIKIEKE